MRVFSPLPLAGKQDIRLEGNAARHIQVLRMQPGQTLRLFDGTGGEFEASISAMGRNSVSVLVGSHIEQESENPLGTHLFVGVPANERMDWLVEKATELGVTSITPVMTQRGVVRLQGERADKKVRHWQAIAVAACEQSGRNRLPLIHPVQTLSHSLASALAGGADRAAYYRLSLESSSTSIRALLEQAQATTIDSVHLFSGPEGGFTPEEESLLEQRGWQALNLGPRTLRAETAPIMALSVLAACRSA